MKSDIAKTAKELLQMLRLSRLPVGKSSLSLIHKRYIRKTRHVLSRRKVPELTANRYPSVKRGGYASLTESDLDYFKSLLSQEAVLTEKDELEGYNTDWMGIVRGQSQCVVRPKTTAEVSQILQYCNERQLAVCPQGGNTGLVGGSVPVFDEVILSTQLMNNIISLDPVSGIIMCQAGCILENVDNHLAEHSLMMPLDLGAKGSCHIGGNISTNAGGIRLLKYGSLHGSVVGVEAVLANGEVLDCLSTLRKDNTGYDLKQLFIGSEGTLGIVTAASILCPQRPNSQSVAFLACKTFDQVLETFQVAKSNLGEILSAFEFMDNLSMDCVCHNLGLSNPIEDSNFYVLVETSGSHAPHDEEKLAGFLEKVVGSEIVLDGTMTSDPSKTKAIWKLRENIAEGLLHDGYCYKYDISLPMDQYYGIVEDMRLRLKDIATRVCGYGHVGDGNLHFNVTSRKYDKAVVSAIEPYIYEFVSECRGSISAEHGLGFMKNKYIYHSKSATSVQVMKQMKKLFDPNEILNPYKTLPADTPTDHA